MNDSSRPIYRAFAWSFIGIGGAFLLVVVLELALNFDFFKGNPFPVALFLMFIGGALLYTAHEKPISKDEKSVDEDE